MYSLFKIKKKSFVIYLFLIEEIAVECFEKVRGNKKILPLTAQKDYMLIYNEMKTPQPKPKLERSPTILRRSLSNSPQNTNTKPNNTQTVTTTVLQQNKPKSKPELRNSSGSSVNNKRQISLSQSENLGKPAQADSLYKPPADYSKIKLNALAQRNKNQTNLTSLELKPATVEGKKTLAKLF